MSSHSLKRRIKERRPITGFKSLRTVRISFSHNSLNSLFSEIYDRGEVCLLGGMDLNLRAYFIIAGFVFRVDQNLNLHSV